MMGSCQRQNGDREAARHRMDELDRRWRKRLSKCGETVNVCTTCPARIITTARTKTKVRGEIASGLSVSGEEMMEGCVCVCVHSMCVCVRECEFSLVLLSFLAAKNRISQQQCASLHFVYICYPMK